MGVAADGSVANTKGAGGDWCAVQNVLVLVESLANVGWQLLVPSSPPLASLLLNGEAALDLGKERERERKRREDLLCHYIGTRFC